MQEVILEVGELTAISQVLCGISRQALWPVIDCLQASTDRPHWEEIAPLIVSCAKAYWAQWDSLQLVDPWGAAPPVRGKHRQVKMSLSSWWFPKSI